MKSMTEDLKESRLILFEWLCDFLIEHCILIIHNKEIFLDVKKCILDDSDDHIVFDFNSWKIKKNFCENWCVNNSYCNSGGSVILKTLCLLIHKTLKNTCKEYRLELVHSIFFNFFNFISDDEC